MRFGHFFLHFLHQLYWKSVQILWKGMLWLLDCATHTCYYTQSGLSIKMGCKDEEFIAWHIGFWQPEHHQLQFYKQKKTGFAKSFSFREMGLIHPRPVNDFCHFVLYSDHFQPVIYYFMHPSENFYILRYLFGEMRALYFCSWTWMQTFRFQINARSRRFPKCKIKKKLLLEHSTLCRATKSAWKCMTFWFNSKNAVIFFFIHACSEFQSIRNPTSQIKQLGSFFKPVV